MKLLTRNQVAKLITDELGLPISPRTLANLQWRGEGPAVEGKWGKWMMYDPDKALAWARERFRVSTG